MRRDRFLTSRLWHTQFGWTQPEATGASATTLANENVDVGEVRTNPNLGIDASIPGQPLAEVSADWWHTGAPS